MTLSPILVVVSIVFLNTSELSVSSQSTPILTGNSRIVGGYEISIKKAPWIVQVFYNNDVLCGGSIISRTRILSAAHCTMGNNAKLFTIRAGSAKLLTGGHVRGVSKIIEHPQYDQVSNQNDISILFLRRPLKLSSRISVIAINKRPSDLRHGTVVTISGWGLVCEKCGVSTILRAVKVKTVDNDRCRKVYGKTEIKPSMFCCGLKKGGKDSCQGDSGGPVTLGKSLVGIVSFGRGCARPNVPGVYTRVSYFAPWIKRYL